MPWRGGEKEVEIEREGEGGTRTIHIDIHIDMYIYIYTLNILIYINIYNVYNVYIYIYIFFFWFYFRARDWGQPETPGWTPQNYQKRCHTRHVRSVLAPLVHAYTAAVNLRPISQPRRGSQLGQKFIAQSFLFQCDVALPDGDVATSWDSLHGDSITYIDRKN